MKIISFILLLCFTLNSFAATGVLSALEKQMDEYNYALTVEWDQKDQSFYDKTTKAFLEGLDKLYKEEGLSSEDVMFMLEKRIKDRTVLSSLKLKMSLLGQSASPREIMENLKGDAVYSQGASWTGDTMIWMIGGFAVVIVALLVGHELWWNDNHVCTKYDQADQCTDEYDCQGDYCYYGGTYCGVITRCTKYERK